MDQIKNLRGFNPEAKEPRTKTPWKESRSDVDAKFFIDRSRGPDQKLMRVKSSISHSLRDIKYLHLKNCFYLNFFFLREVHLSVYQDVCDNNRTHNFQYHNMYIYIHFSQYYVQHANSTRPDSHCLDRLDFSTIRQQLLMTRQQLFRRLFMFSLSRLTSECSTLLRSENRSPFCAHRAYGDQDLLTPLLQSGADTRQDDGPRI